MAMEVCPCPTTTPLRRPRWSSSSAAAAAANDDQSRMIEFFSSLLSAVVLSLCYAILIFFFAVVGTTLGAIIGAVFGIKSERRKGLFHGAAVGAFTGASFSIHAVNASLAFWISSYDDEPLSFPRIIEDITTVLKPTLAYLGEEFGPGSSHGPVRNQVAPVETNNQVPRSVNSKRANASSRGSEHDKLPKTRITRGNIYDTSGNRISCSVCLEDFEVGEVAGRLPICQHMFHPRCIAKWRIRHRSCPLCRTNQ